MEQQATTPRPEVITPIDVEQAEAALMEHYPRLVRLGYLVLPPELGRKRRVLTAHAVAQRALPRNRAAATGHGLPAPRTPDGARTDPGYAFVRIRVVRAALAAGRPRKRWQPPRPGQLPPPLPRVWGLRLFPRSGGAEELALEQALSALSGPGRAAYVLRALERMGELDALRALDAAGVDDPDAALDEADAVELPAGSRAESLLTAPEFDPCSLQARPTDLMRRRQHSRAAIAALAAVAVCGTLLSLPGSGWGPDGAAAPPYARNAAAERALDPASLTRAAPTAWKTADRGDFSTWPERGNRVGDAELLHRALAVWARPGRDTRASATPGTLPGPPPGPPQLLYAGEVGSVAVVILHDGLRVVRYAEPKSGKASLVALDFARADAADAASATALVVARVDGNVRYLTAPWVKDTAVRDLLKPTAAARPLHRSADGVTDPVPSPAAGAQNCENWPALQLGDRLVTDLGELFPARLTYGSPKTGDGHDVNNAAGRASWAHAACHLAGVRGQGVRSVNSWRFATQPLPGGAGSAEWACTRTETWRGGGSQALALFRPPNAAPGAPGALVARSAGSRSCGPHDPTALAGALWKSPAGQWYLLAAGSPRVASITATGGVRGSAPGHLLAVPAKDGARAKLSARLTNGKKLTPLH
ncbi:hypothetical protein AB0I49_32660 [Streptomyces sp. NPDC050617]|uniref:hypothetical protein n=1 Tax=Streptomyces sp. NPDC050617 TaxID=3154628 RepID=UPI00341277D6